jgi:hypothetical protein
MHNSNARSKFGSGKAAIGLTAVSVWPLLDAVDATLGVRGLLAGDFFFAEGERDGMKFLSGGASLTIWLGRLSIVIRTPSRAEASVDQKS